MNTNIRTSLLALTAVAFLAGCAHPITIAPDMSKLVRDEAAKPRVETQVGYFISEQNRALRVKTPAGGGDFVEYAPYADLETGLYRVLSNVFTNVHVVKNVQDKEFLTSKNISYLFTPTLTTTSSSRNSFFWPPTDFTVTIDCVAADDQTQQVWKTSVQEGNDVVAVKDTLADHGLAGKKAAEKALKKLQAELEAAPVFRK